MLVRLFTLGWLLMLVAPASATDPHPPQITVSFVARPAPLKQNGTTRLYYEMLVTSFSKESYVLDVVETKAGATQSHFEGPELASLILRPGEAGKSETSEDRTLQGGRTVVIFLELNIGGEEVPASIENTLRLRDDKGEVHDVKLAPLEISNEAPLVIAAPLRGEWIAGDSSSNRPDAAHRRAILFESGRAWIAQRFAIDWVQYRDVDGKRTTWKGPEDKNDSYFCYDQPIYSVAAGKVVQVSDGMPENVPHSGKLAVAVDFNNAAGNHAVVEIAPHRYVLYAHMRPGTVLVKLGDVVDVGQPIGRIGNTGSSAEPHLHMHIDDQPSFLAGNGVPYAFASGLASGAVDANVSSPTAIYFGPIGPQHEFTNDFPAENALVTFK
jgi:murein DD-endopeptidase MepM/ murein hydrolase activator NlpD